MRKFFLYIIFFIFSSNVFPQTWQGAVFYTSQSGSCAGQTHINVGPSQFVSNGFASVPSSAGSCNLIGGSSYFTNISLATGKLCVPNNFSFEINLRSGQFFRNDIAITLVGSGQNTGCYLLGYNPSSPGDSLLVLGPGSGANVFVGGTNTGPLPSLIFPIDNSYHTYKFQYKSNNLIFFKNNIEFFKIPYTGNICDITNISVGFKGSGSIDWMRVLDENEVPIWREDFTSVSTLNSFPNNCGSSINTLLSYKSPTCSSNNLELIATPSTFGSFLSYQWTGPNGFSSNLQNPVITNPTTANNGLYTCTVKINNCSSASQTFTQNVIFSPINIDPIQGNNNICINGTSQLTNTTIGGVWTSSNSSIASIDSLTGLVTGLNIGSCTITYKISPSCISTFLINVTNVVSSIVGDTVLCIGSKVQLSSSSIGGKWFSSNVSVAIIDSISGLVTGISNGTSTISYTIFNGLSKCISLQEITVNKSFIPSISVKASKQTICLNDSLILNIISDGVSIKWLKGIEFLNNDTGFNVIAKPTKTIQFLAETKNLFGCKNYDSVKIIVNNNPIINFLPNPLSSICPYDTIRITATSLYTSNFLWSTSNFIISSLNNSSILIKPSFTKTYKVEVVDSNFCRNIDSIEVTVLDFKPPFLGNDRNICKNDSIILNPGIYTNYLWQDGSVNTYFNAKRIGKYWVNVSNSLGCTASDTLNILSYNDFPQNFLPDDTIICRGKKVDLLINGYKNYKWSTGTLSNREILKNIGKYYLEVEDFNGCKGKDSFAVFNKGCVMFQIPNAFTPNGDGLNDNFKPLITQDVNNYIFRIFNRFGQIVFETSKLFYGWNGKINGRLQSSGTYIYQVKFNDTDNNPQIFEGSFLLIR